MPVHTSSLNCMIAKYFRLIVLAISILKIWDKMVIVYTKIIPNYCIRVLLSFKRKCFLQIVTSSLSGYTQKYEEMVKEGSSSTWLGTLSNMVGNMFIQVGILNSVYL